MQQIVITGKLGRDAETRQAGQDSVTSFSVAVDARNGREKITNWWRVSLWGKRGEALAQYLTKGSAVTVSGEFSLGEFDGKPQLNIRANDVALQGGRAEGGQPRQQGGGSDWGQQAKSAFPDADLDEDIPFISSMVIW